MTAILPYFASSAAASTSFQGVTANMVAALNGAATGGSLLSSIGTGLTLASAATTLFGGFSNASASRQNAEFQAQNLAMQSQEELLAEKQEELRGQQASNAIMDNLSQTIAQQQLYYATAGIDPSFGTPVDVDKSTRKLANLQLSTSRSDAQLLALSRRRQAYALQTERLNTLAVGNSSATNSIFSGVAGAGGSLADLVQRRSSRG